jgi:predicted enzyme related to lactoylglutathione lyase
MKVVEIAFTGYPVTDLKRARRFYEQTLGLTVSRVFGDENLGWVEYDIGAATLAICNGAPQWKPSPGGGSAGLEVDDFPAAIQQIRSAGHPLVVEPIETPVCHMAVVSDPDGNSITLHRRKPAHS